MTTPRRALVLLATLPLLASCVSAIHWQPVEWGWTPAQAWAWLKSLTPRLESPCRDGGHGPERLCRSYVAPNQERYIAVHDGVTLELLRIIRVEEWQGGVRQVLVWREPSDVGVRDRSVML